MFWKGDLRLHVEKLSPEFLRGPLQLSIGKHQVEIENSLNFGLDMNIALKPFHRSTIGPWPLKTIETNDEMAQKPLKNPYCQWLEYQKNIQWLSFPKQK